MDLEKTINRILKNYSEEDKIPSGKALSKWADTYKIWDRVAHLNHKQTIEAIGNFKTTKGTSEDYRKAFGIGSFDYIEPLSFGFSINENKKQQISTELENLLNFTFEEIYHAVDFVYRLAPHDWTFENLEARLEAINPTQAEKLLIQSTINTKNIAS